MRTRTNVVLVLVLMLAAATAALMAAPRATLVLRNGDRIQTELIDLGGVGFTIRSGNSNETIAANDVALIDFVGGTTPQSEVALMQNGSPFIALRNGDIVAGRLTDIGGTDPLRLTVRTNNGNQDFNSNEVARIFLAKWDGMPSAGSQQAGTGRGQGQQQGRGQGQSQSQQGQGRGQGQAQGRNRVQGQTISIPANQCWTNTGIYVDAGQPVQFAVSGEIQLSNDRNDLAGAAGSKAGRYSRRAPLPQDLLGALIGRIDNRRPFGIGDQRGFLPMPESGELWIGINDDNCGDNRGEFRVTINDRR